MKQGSNRRLVNKIALRFSQCLLVLVVWLMTYASVKAFEQDNRAVAVLQYHHVSEDTPFLTSIIPKDFEAHLDYLVQNQFNVISLSRFLDQIKSGELSPHKTAVITFDDAYSSIHDVAWPLLKERNFPFSVFVNTEAVDQKLRHSMTWTQMRSMAEQGVEFANHTHSHLHLIRKLVGETELAWLDRIRQEIESAEAKIKQELGQSHKALAYPFGEYNLDVMSLLSDMGYVGFAQHSGAVGVMTDPHAIPRFPFGGYYTSLEDFATKVNALAMPVRSTHLGEALGIADEAISDAENMDAVILENLPELNKGSWLYSYENAKPAVFFEVALNKRQARQIACYASGQGRVPMALVGQLEHPDDEYSGFLVETLKPAPVGRSRFNCTLPSQWSGRFYWFSQPVIRLAEHNQWYQE